MGLPSDNFYSFVQPNIGPNDNQEEVIDSLNNLSWRSRRSIPQYMGVEFVIEDKIIKDHKIEREAAQEIIQQRLERLRPQQ